MKSLLSLPTAFRGSAFPVPSVSVTDFSFFSDFRFFPAILLFLPRPTLSYLLTPGSCPGIFRTGPAFRFRLSFLPP